MDRFFYTRLLFWQLRILELMIILSDKTSCQILLYITSGAVTTFSLNQSPILSCKIISCILIPIHGKISYI